MKREYNIPQLEITLFEEENILIASGQYESVSSKVSDADKVLDVNFEKWGETLKITY